MSDIAHKRKISKIITILAIILISGPIFYLIFDQKEPQQEPVPVTGQLTVLWAEWPPADDLQELSNEFTKETGIDVTIVQESWGNWQTIFFDEMAKKGQKYDMVIGDSQWLGRGARGGHYIELTKWVQQHGVDKSMIPAAMTGYSEFPKGSGHYWAIPVEGDATGFLTEKIYSKILKRKKISTRNMDMNSRCRRRGIN